MQTVNAVSELVGTTFSIQENSKYFIQDNMLFIHFVPWFSSIIGIKGFIIFLMHITAIHIAFRRQQISCSWIS